MNPQSEEFSPRRARILTFMVLIVVAAGIGLANLSSEPVTVEFLDETVFKGKPAERDFGWPIKWYARSRVEIRATVPVSSRWPVSAYSAKHLAVNLAMWIVMLAVAAAACWRLLRRYGPRLRWRPRITTILLLGLVSALAVLVNLSFDDSPGPRPSTEYSNYGWPLTWRRRVYVWFPVMSPPYEEWDFSAPALAGNLAIWLLMLAATAFAWERLARRYPPRLRFCLRTMLAGVAMAAAILAWYVAVRDRADKQDAFAEWFATLHGYDDAVDGWSWSEFDDLYLEYRGQKWFGVIGADRLRRHIVGARFTTWRSGGEPEQNRECFKRLAQLPSLRFLELRPDTSPLYEFTRDMTATLGEMQQLRMLNFACQGEYRDETLPVVREYLAAIGKLTQLERLRLSIWTDSSQELASLSGLTNLKTLSLDIQSFAYPAEKNANESGSNSETGLLGRLPAFPRLEQLDLSNTPVGDDDLDLVARLKRLQTLDLGSTDVSDAGLSKLAPLESLEELVIDQRVATVAGLETLNRFKRLRTIHIADAEYDTTRSGLAVSLDAGHKLAVTRSQRDGIRSALEALRQSHPGIVIDGNYGFDKLIDLEAPWDSDDPGMRAFVERWLYGR